MDTVANLRAFLAVARYGGFSEAARQLNLVPSVAAKRVSQLEHTIGTKLFERSTRKVVLTESGEQFQGRARSLLADLDDTLAGLKRAGDVVGRPGVESRVAGLDDAARAQGRRAWVGDAGDAEEQEEAAVHDLRS